MVPQSSQASICAARYRLSGLKGACGYKGYLDEAISSLHTTLPPLNVESLAVKHGNVRFCSLELAGLTVRLVPTNFATAWILKVSNLTLLSSPVIRICMHTTSECVGAVVRSGAADQYRQQLL